MPLIVLFGVNGSGKDALAKNIKQIYPDLEILSGSRIMMKGMGLDVQINADFPVSTENYQKLESLDQDCKAKMADTVFKDVLQDFKMSGKFGILSSHLVIAKRNGQNISYETDLVRSWFGEVFDSLVFVRANPYEIYQRAEKDKNEGQRDRGFITLESITEQQRLSVIQWEELLSKQNVHNKALSIWNVDSKLEQSASILDKFIKENLFTQISEFKLSGENRHFRL